MFTAQDKLDAVQREIGKRKHVYPRLVAEKKLSPAKSAREIAVMEAIAEDYRVLAEKERLI
jgi:hypothetical protein